MKKLIAHLKHIAAEHRKWGWVADVDAQGNITPANPKRKARFEQR